MQLAIHATLKVPSDRQRGEFDEKSLDELIASIKGVGLLQPLVLRNDGITLVAGERRLRAIRKLNRPYTHNGVAIDAESVPYVLVSQLSENDLFLAELDENLCRKDLTWQERAKALKRLHEIRTAQNPKQTVKATAEEAKGAKPSNREVTEASNAILLDQWLNDPEVAAQPTQADALKVIRDRQNHQQRVAAAAGVDFTKSPHTLHIADCYVDARARYPGVFDVVITDPPYGIDAHEKDTFDASSHEYDDSYEVAFARVRDELPSLCKAITKADAHVYVFCDIRRFEQLHDSFILGGWTVWPKPLIWDKGNTGSYGNIAYGPRACYDAILYARRGDKKVVATHRDVINITQPTNLPHPAGKPPELFAELINRSCFPGEKVADLFAGSGPIFAAAVMKKVYATAWENHPKYSPMAQEALLKTMGKK